VVLADTSAWAWSSKPVYAELRLAFEERLESGEIATCDMVVVELLRSVQSGDEFDVRRDDLGALRRCPIGERQWRRALDVMQELVHRTPLGHRSVRHQDLLIAAAAEAAGLPVLHYDEDYERIAAVTGQPIEWLAPKGSLR
jgi:predicted nucleic acid-binding protein